MKALIRKWQTYLPKEEVEEHLIAFCQSSEEDKECMISEAFGIFDGSLKGNIYTYFFYDCETLNYRYLGTDNWYKGADIYRVDYNFMTDEAVVTKLNRFNRKATENNCRML